MATHTFDRGGADDGTLDVSLFTFYGEEYVWTDIEPPATGFGLTADQARAYAADLITHADALDERNAEGGATEVRAYDYGIPPPSLPPVPDPPPHNWADPIPRRPRCRCSTTPEGYEVPGSSE